jgi:hypothetical protein
LIEGDSSHLGARQIDHHPRFPIAAMQPTSKASITDSKSPVTITLQQDDRNVDRGEIEALNPPPHSSGVRRDLKRRHINMIAIAGMIVSSYSPHRTIRCH